MTYIIGEKKPDYSAPIIFLDIDGVLNGLNTHGKELATIKPECMANLNYILRETDANLVISSAWRYLITPDTMTFDGFKYLLTTHGLRHGTHIIGKTRPDGGKLGDDRAKQIFWWLSDHYDYDCGLRERDPYDLEKDCPVRYYSSEPALPVPPWIAIDDTWMESLAPINRVHINLPHNGLSETDANKAVSYLRQQKEKPPTPS